MDDLKIELIKSNRPKSSMYNEVLESNQSLLSGYRFYLRDLPQKKISKHFYYLVMFNHYMTEFQEKFLEKVADVDFVYFLFDWFVKYYSDKSDENEAEKVILAISEFYKYLQNQGKIYNISMIKNLKFESNMLKERINAFHNISRDDDKYMNELKEWSFDIYRIWDEIEEKFFY